MQVCNLLSTQLMMLLLDRTTCWSGWSNQLAKLPNWSHSPSWQLSVLAGGERGGGVNRIQNDGLQSGAVKPNSLHRVEVNWAHSAESQVLLPHATLLARPSSTQWWCCWCGWSSLWHCNIWWLWGQLNSKLSAVENQICKLAQTAARCRVSSLVE